MYRIGVDLGGTNIAVGLVDETYHIVCKASAPTLAGERTAEEIVDAIAALCAEVAKQQGIALSSVDAIGVASPGVANQVTGEVEYSCNLPFVHTPICEMLRTRTGVGNVHVENDANAAAFGEAVAGAAKGAKSSITVTLGTGVGGGIIMDGKVISGFNFAGGELGHMVIEQGGVACNCGRRGCFESYSSATALVRMTKEKIEECAAAGRKTLMAEMVARDGKVSGRTAFDAERKGDAAAAEVVAKYLSYLATGLTNLINILQPEVVAIGGGISGEGDNLLSRLAPMVEKECYGYGIVKSTRLAIAQLGNDAGIIGAAFLGIA